MLNVSGVHLHYGASHALRGVDMTSEKGRVTCVLGRNGVGKSSLSRAIPDKVFTLFPVLNDMLGRRGGDLSGGQQQQLAIGRALVTRPSLLILDESTEGIQPSIIKQIEETIRALASRGDMAMVLVEQYFEFARDLADSFIVLDRGQVVLAGDRETLLVRETEVRGYLTV